MSVENMVKKYQRNLSVLKFAMFLKQSSRYRYWSIRSLHVACDTCQTLTFLTDIGEILVALHHPIRLEHPAGRCV
jgi:hypothetical protein